jgi:Mannitol-1-phosphate/altronate dehydrogenases
MRITENYINNNDFADRDIVVPKYDSEVVKQATKQNPRWVHFGAGNLYRCFHAQIVSELLNIGEMSEGIIVAETFGEDLIEEVYHANQNRSLTVTMKANGDFTKELVASTTEALFFHPKNPTDVERLVAIFKEPSLEMVTLTITEKGYAVKDSNGELLPQVQSDIASGLEFAKLENTMAKLTYLLYQRFKANELPIAMVSTDNFSHNGDRFKEAILVIAKGLRDAGHVEESFISYLSKGEKVSFPFSMIDRITPLPNEEIARQLSAEGIEGMMPFVSKRQKMNLAAFVNTEEIHYLAIEDDFPNGRPALAKATGVFLGNRDTINKADLMKVCTCLNPLHTALAIFGCLLGYDRICKEVQDDDLRGLIEQIGFIEGLPVVENPEIINPNDFINEVIYKRFANPNVPDTPQRIASDTSQKVGIRYGETLKAYVEAVDKDVRELNFIPLTIAAWCRYLMAIDDAGGMFEPSPDPLYQELHEKLAGITYGEADGTIISKALQPILCNVSIFGVDLVAIGLSEKIEKYFTSMIARPGAVRLVLQKELKTRAKNIKGR